MLTVPARLLGEADRGEIERLLDTDPIAAAQVAERMRAGDRFQWRREARVLGFGPRRGLRAICWLGPNLIPVRADDAAVAAFTELVAREPRAWSSLVGDADAVLGMWRGLARVWGPARDVRPCQPLLATWSAPAAAPDPEVRLVRPSEVNAFFPAAVAMYQEEVGVSPTLGDGGRDYRARVAELVRARRAYARFAHGQVIFKAELAVITGHTTQVQGVWVAPEYRGRGLAAGAVSAVVHDALRRVAPSVSLYVNDYNTVARRVYDRCGFRQLGTFATVLL